MENVTPSAASPAQLGMTEEEIERLPAVLSIPQAGAAFGLHRDTAYDLARRGEFPVETFRVGKRQKVSKHILLTHLGIRAA